MLRHGIYLWQQGPLTSAHGRNFLPYKLVHCCLRVIERRERTSMMVWGSGEATLKSLCLIAAALTLVASSWTASA